MRIADMVRALQPGRKKNPVTHTLTTIWSQEAEDGPQALPLPEYPRPRMRRGSWQNLNGWWDYAIRPAGAGMGKADGRILVPFSPETVRSGVGRILQPGQDLWYRRTVMIGDLKEGSRLLLHFGAVDERCRVWWNGHAAGSHRNGYLAFCLDVTDYVRPGANELLVCVRDDTDRGTACRGKQTLEPEGMYYHAQSGIWQTVWLESVPELYLKDLRVSPRPGEEEVLLEMEFSGAGRGRQVRITVGEDAETGAAGNGEKTGEKAETGAAGNGEETGEDTDAGADRTGEAGAGEKAGADTKTAVCVKSFRIEKSRVRVRIPVPCPRLWSPDDPHLYALRIEAGKDLVESYFAMRSFGTGTDSAGRPCLTLNGQPYFFHGVLDQGYWPETLMTAPADEAMVFDILQMKEAGFNMIRKHVKIEAARWYYHCDRLGMVVWQDMVNGGGPVNKLLQTYLPTVFPGLGKMLRDDRYRLFAREDGRARQRFEADLRKMIRQLCSSPCIGMWIPFNEGWGQFDALRIAEIVREEDPDRPVDHASGWFDQGGGDVCSVHNYFREPAVEKDPRPFVLSEYGGINAITAGHVMSDEVYGYHTVEPDVFRETFQTLMDKIHALVPQGLSGAVYTQVSDIEEETNGLLTYDRRVNKIINDLIINDLIKNDLINNG